MMYHDRWQLRGSSSFRRVCGRFGISVLFFIKSKQNKKRSHRARGTTLVTFRPDNDSFYLKFSVRSCKSIRFSTEKIEESDCQFHEQPQ